MVTSAPLNDLYKGRDVEPARLQRLVSLFRLDFADPLDMYAGRCRPAGVPGFDDERRKCGQTQAEKPADQFAAARAVVSRFSARLRQFSIAWGCYRNPAF